MFYKFKLVWAFTLVSSLSFKSAMAYTYIAKEGDTLSDILYQNNIKPIYGRKGMMKEILKLNPKMRHAKGNLIHKGDKIILIEMPNDRSLTALEKAVPLEKPNEARRVSDIFDQIFFWQISPSVSWKELKATDSNAFQNSKARVLSDMSYGAGIVYGMRITPDLDLYSKLSVEAVNFSNDNSITVLKKNFTTAYLGVGGFYKKIWQFETGMGDELYLTSPNASSVEIKKVSMFQMKTIFKKAFYQFQEATLAYALSGRVLFPHKVSGFSPEFSYGAGVGLEAKLRNQSFYIGYEESFLKADSNSTDSKNILWRYTWETP